MGARSKERHDVSENIHYSNTAIRELTSSSVFQQLSPEINF
jgi:hypothetical protein